MSPTRDGPAAAGGLAAILSEVARTLQAEPDVESTLEAITRAAVEHIGGDAAGLSLRENGVIRTMAPTDELVVTVDKLQARFQEGPCLGAIAEHQTYRTGDLEHERRWPRFGPAAVSLGVRSMLAYRLFVTDTTLGALNLYSSRPDAFSAEAESEGLLFASHAAVALVGAQTEHHLQAAIRHRDTIGIAKGILVERHRISVEDAFSMLVRTSQHANLKLHAVATWLVEQSGQDTAR
ncbi:GAF and ANTAR domain-containing protein [Amycolatopsis sp. NBC_00348]|uniref:GAF and ANTAR domain-containing protein n=1 Tax=Amycolatopsis sp. NBC_00348 TaxID=2975956 RepID=UPI002E26348D